MNMNKRVSKKEVEDFYDSLYKEGQEDAIRPERAYSGYLRLMNIIPGKRLLDIACGSGYFLRYAEKLGLETYGLEISKEAANVAKRVAVKSKIVVGEGEKLPYENNFFDYVTNLGSLEHFMDMNKGLKEMVRVGKDDAEFFIMVPNANFWFFKFQRRKGTKGQKDLIENLLSFKEWKELIERNGLRIVKVSEDKPVFKNKLKQILLEISRILLPKRWTYQFIFICKKR